MTRLYSEVKEKVVLPKLQEAKHFDKWYADWYFLSFVHEFYSTSTLTGHFLWLDTSFCLDTVPTFDHIFFEDDTGQNIAHAFREVFQDWNLDPRKFVVTTTDSGRNYVAALTTLEREWVSGFGHTLNLAISKAVQIDRVQRAIWRCHALVELFSHSWKICRDFRFKQESLPKHKLITACVYVCVCVCVRAC